MSVTNSLQFEFIVDGDSAMATDIKNDIIQYIQRVHTSVHSMKVKHTNEIQQWWAEPIVPREPLERQIGGPTFPTMERQQAVPPQDAFVFPLPTEEEMAAARAAFPGVDEWEEGGEELGEEMSEAVELDDGDSVTTEDTVRVAYSGWNELECECAEINALIADNPESAFDILSEEHPDPKGFYMLTGFEDGGNRRTYAIPHKKALLTKGVYRDEAGDDGILRTSEGFEYGYWNKTLRGFVIPPRFENVTALQQLLSDQNMEYDE